MSNSLNCRSGLDPAGLFLLHVSIVTPLKATHPRACTASASSCSGGLPRPRGTDSSAYRAVPSTRDEFSGNDEPTACDADAWDEFR